jgi:plasmid stabilization system protein ParE
MTDRVVISPGAEREIQQQAFWLLAAGCWLLAAGCWLLAQARSATTALRWARALRATIASLEANPHRCPVDPDSDVYGEEVRLLLHGRRGGTFRILFAIRGETVAVLTVRHASRPSLLEELGDEA